MNRLSPELYVFRHSGPMPTAPEWAAPGAYVYTFDVGIRVTSMYDIGATPMEGRWKVRIDVYDDTRAKAMDELIAGDGDLL